MSKEEFEPTKAEEGYGELTHIEAENEYGILLPDGREVFHRGLSNYGGVTGEDLKTLQGQGKAQDGYAATLKMHGVPVTLGLRLRFIKRKRVTSVTETIDLHTEA